MKNPISWTEEWVSAEEKFINYASTFETFKIRFAAKDFSDGENVALDGISSEGDGFAVIN